MVRRESSPVLGDELVLSGGIGGQLRPTVNIRSHNDHAGSRGRQGTRTLRRGNAKGMAGGGWAGSGGGGRGAGAGGGGVRGGGVRRWAGGGDGAGGLRRGRGGVGFPAARTRQVPRLP